MHGDMRPAVASLEPSEDPGPATPKIRSSARDARWDLAVAAGIAEIASGIRGRGVTPSCQEQDEGGQDSRRGGRDMSGARRDAPVWFPAPRSAAGRNREEIWRPTVTSPSSIPGSCEV